MIGVDGAALDDLRITQVTEWFTIAASDTITVAAGCSIFPKEVPRCSRRWAQRRFANIVHWNQPGRGGHFAAWEQPGLFIGEVRAVARATAPLRRGALERPHQAAPGNGTPARVAVASARSAWTAAAQLD